MSPTTPPSSNDGPFSISPHPPSSAPRSFDPWQLDTKSDGELDEMPFGVIGLDASGIILRYNAYEARMARLDRNQVLGRTFFGDVAPCTRVDAFEGRFRRLAASNQGEVIRFSFVFDFKFGAQEVDIEMLRAPSAERFYLLVNRRRVLEPRKDVDPAILPPLQRELAPREASLGVRRNAYERRVVVTSSLLLAALRHTCDRVAPKGWPLLCEEWGLQWGRRATFDLQAQAIEAQGKELREVPMATLADMLASHLRDEGWGSLTLDFSPSREGLFAVHLDRSAIAEAAGASKEPRCQLFSGFLSAFFSGVAGKKLVAREALCAAQGHPRCSFLVAKEPRRQAIDLAIAEGGDLAEILRRVRGER